MKLLRKIVIIVLGLFCLLFCMCAVCIRIGCIPPFPAAKDPYLNPTNEYIKAIKAGTDLDRIKELIDKGEDMNALDRSGLAPLHAIFKTIYDNTIHNEQDLKNYSADEIEASRNAIDTLYKAAELLLDNGADVDVRDRYGKTPLQYCSDVRCGKFFLKYGADINIGLPSNPEVLKLFIANVADINERNSEGETLLFRCIYRETAELLIRNGADVKIRNFKGETPLFGCHNDDTVEFMIRSGADVNAKNLKGETALFYVEDPERVRLLVKYKIRVNEQDNDGRTALHNILNKIYTVYSLAIPKTILELLESGASVGIKDKDGITPLDIAKDQANTKAKYCRMPVKEIYDTMLKYKK